MTKFWFALHVSYDESFSDDPRGARQVGGGLPATLAVTRVIFFGTPQPVEGHRRHCPLWPLIFSYPTMVFQMLMTAPFYKMI